MNQGVLETKITKNKGKIPFSFLYDPRKIRQFVQKKMAYGAKALLSSPLHYCFSKTKR